MKHRSRFRIAIVACALLAAGPATSCFSPEAGNPRGGAGGTGSGGTTPGSGGSNGGTAPGAGGSSGAIGAGGSSGGTAPGGSAGAVGSGGSAGGSAGTGGSAGGTVLDQTGNPVHGLLDTYKGWLDGSGNLAADQALADNIVTWQMPHGGFFKREVSVYSAPWNGSAPRSDWYGADNVEIGTIDNDGTTTELMFLADVYQRSGDAEYRDSARSVLDFLIEMQYSSGGFPQVYPARVGAEYSNRVTFNDDAMVRVLLVLDRVAKLEAPLGQDLFTAEQRSLAAGAVASATGYILAAQIVQAGARTVWCAQHDPVSYAPMGARSYELPSKSGKESAGVVGFLMTQPQTPEIESAVRAALAWYDSDAAKVENTAYVNRPSGSTDDNYNPIQSQPGSTMWYRFYDLDADVGFFSGRLPTDQPPGEGKQYDIMDIEPERRYGYGWGGPYGTALLTYASSVGY